MNGNNVIQITISRQIVPVPQESFGVMAVAAPFTTFTDRIRYYSATTGMVTDGFQTTDAAYIEAAAVFSQATPPAEIAVVRRDPADPNWATALNAVIAVDNTWYGLVACDNSGTGIAQIAAWAEAASPKRLYVGLSGDPECLDPSSTTDIAYVLKNTSYTHTALIYTGSPSTNPLDGAWMGQLISFPPGSATWFGRTLNGVTTDNLSDSQFTAAKNKNCNTYTITLGEPTTAPGIVAVGEYIDIIQGIDALGTDMQTRVFGAIKGVPKKLSMTDPYITVVLNAIHASLDDFTETNTEPNLLAKGTTSATVPTRASMSPSNVANRNLANCTFTGQLAEAIHFVGIQGTVTL